MAEDAREQIARALAESRPWNESWDSLADVPGDRLREQYRITADAVLAAAAVAEALAAVDRVRAFVDGFAERGGGKITATDELWIMSIRRALGGHP